MPHQSEEALSTAKPTYRCITCSRLTRELSQQLSSLVIAHETKDSPVFAKKTKSCIAPKQGSSKQSPASLPPGSLPCRAVLSAADTAHLPIHIPGKNTSTSGETRSDSRCEKEQHEMRINKIISCKIKKQRENMRDPMSTMSWPMEKANSKLIRAALLTVTV